MAGADYAGGWSCVQVHTCWRLWLRGVLCASHQFRWLPDYVTGERL